MDLGLIWESRDDTAYMKISSSFSFLFRFSIYYMLKAELSIIVYCPIVILFIIQRGYDNLLFYSSEIIAAANISDKI